LATTAAAKKKPRYRNNQKPGSHADSLELISHNCHFSANTLEVINRHSALYKSRGISGLVRTVVEMYLFQRINFDDPKYSGLEPVIPREIYPGQYEKLGLA
jgi:hypothetical protein